MFYYINAQKVPVSKEIYCDYGRLTYRENYLNRLEIKYQSRLFSDYTENKLLGLIIDYEMDIESINETKELLKLLCEALLTLNREWFALTKDLFFDDKTLNEIVKFLSLLWIERVIKF